LIVITVPACNESKFLRKAVKTLLRETAALGDNYRIVIAEDGSTDGTDKIAHELANKNPHVIHLHADKKLGRGLALRKAWSKVEGDIYVYIDCDLASDMKYFPFLVNSIKKGYDLATGSRYIEGAKVRRPAIRYFTSKIYNWLIQAAFKTGMHDHQAGFKAFSERLVKDLMNSCKSTDWFWDTEIIIRSRQKGYKCVEFPVEWEEKRGNRTPLKRLISDVYVHGRGLIKMTHYLNKERTVKKVA
jgi:glycosyltransferase involved in cell wall biosynthesis